LGSRAGRIPELVPSLRGYAEATGSRASADAAPEPPSAGCGSLEPFAPPSELPKILVRSPNVEFPYLKSLPRDRLRRCRSAASAFFCRSVPGSRRTPLLGIVTVQAIKLPLQTSREGFDRIALVFIEPHPFVMSLLGAASKTNEAAQRRGRQRFPIAGSSSAKAMA
jgi:hypothetical protein